MVASGWLLTWVLAVIKIILIEVLQGVTGALVRVLISVVVICSIIPSVSLKCLGKLHFPHKGIEKLESCPAAAFR